jgi:endonuclease YncB( thermonuclease family)
VKVGLVLIVLAAATVPVAAQSLPEGDANARCKFVCDGDTLKLNGTTYRLWGIDTPEAKEWCGDYAAGLMATDTLEMLVRGKTVVCVRRPPIATAAQSRFAGLTVRI